MSRQARQASPAKHLTLFPQGNPRTTDSFAKNQVITKVDSLKMPMNMRMRLSNFRFVGLTFAIFSLLDITIAAAEHYYSNVNIGGPALNKDTGQLEGKVGYRFLARVSYQIGFSATQSGSLDIQTPYVTDPEYELFSDELPPGLSFDPQTGQLSGTPTTPGKWEVYPAVRCKRRGDNVYRGDGRWWTMYKNYRGKVWTEAQEARVISISQ